MPKVGSVPPLEVLEGGLAGEEAPQAEFVHALKEVRAVSGALDVCYGKGEVARTELPELPARARRREDPKPPPPVPDTEVEAWLVGLELPAPRTGRARAAARLEEGRAPGEDIVGTTANLKV